MTDRKRASRTWKNANLTLLCDIVAFSTETNSPQDPPPRILEMDPLHELIRKSAMLTLKAYSHYACACACACGCACACACGCACACACVCAFASNCNIVSTRMLHPHREWYRTQSLHLRQFVYFYASVNEALVCIMNLETAVNLKNVSTL